ncbi:MAG: FAD-dependent oxidoreductase [Halobacteriales archaeon]
MAEFDPPDEIETPKGPPLDIDTRTARKARDDDRTALEADICVLGAGIAGVSAALEAAEAGNDVVLVDANSAIGGSAVNAIVGTIIGLYDHGEEPRQLTYGIAEDLVDDLTAEGSMVERTGGYFRTTIYQYDEVRLGRWMEEAVREAGVETLLGTVLTDVGFEDRRVQHLDLANRFGTVRVEADGYVDASGDAVLAWEAGLPTREPDAPVYGTLSFTIEGYDTDALDDFDVAEVHERMEAVGEAYGLVRHDGQLIHHPNEGFMVANVTHLETPLEPTGYAEMVFEGRRQVDAVMDFLRAEFPEVFAGATVRAYGDPGLRQTRWIESRNQLTVEDLRSGDRPDDAVARAAWWIELHDTPEHFHLGQFDWGHVYYIPLSCLVPKGADNLVAAGRCIDADPLALSAVRVMGPCIATGAAAAHALDLAGTDPVHEVDLDALQDRLHDNLERLDT